MLKGLTMKRIRINGHMILRQNRLQLEKRCQTLEEEKKQILIEQRYLYQGINLEYNSRLLVFCSKELETRLSQENYIFPRNFDAQRFSYIIELASVT